MQLVISIALGIVLAVVILAFLPELFKAALVLLVLVGLAIVFAVLMGHKNSPSRTEVAKTPSVPDLLPLPLSDSRLKDSMRSALSAALTEADPPVPKHESLDARLAYLRWLGEASRRLRPRMPEHLTRVQFLETVWYESRRQGVEAALMLGMIETLSGFQRYAISATGARGYMQVPVEWADRIGDGDLTRLFHLQSNLRYGSVVLRFYLDQAKGDLRLALKRYVQRRDPDFPDAVLAARKRWDYDVGEPTIGVVTGRGANAPPNEPLTSEIRTLPKGTASARATSNPVDEPESDRATARAAAQAASETSR